MGVCKMIKSRKPSRYYAWIVNSPRHMQDFQDWLVDNDFDVFLRKSFNRGEVVAFRGKGGRGSLYETGYANTQCINAVTRYLKGLK